MHRPARTDRVVTLHKVIERLDTRTGRMAQLVLHERGTREEWMMDDHSMLHSNPELFDPVFVERLNVIANGQYVFTLTEKEYEHVES